MRIVILSHFKPYPPNHGAAQRIWNLAKQAKKARYEVIIIHNAISGKNERTERIIEGVKLIQVPFMHKSFQKKHFVMQNNLLMFNELRRQKPDILQIEFPYLSPLALFFRIFGKRFLYDSHGVEFDWNKELYSRKGLLLKLVSFVEWMALKGSAQNLSCSDIDTDRLRELYGVVSSTIPNAVNLSAYYKIKPHKFERKTVLFIGSPLHPANRAAIRFIKEELMKIISSKKGVDFCLIGKAPPSLMGTKGLIELGEVEDVRPYVLGADICVAPIYKGTGTRIKILEYMAAGKPVIATEKAIEGILASDGKEILIREDAKSFSEAILMLLKSKKESQRLGKNAKKLIKSKYDWNVVGKQYVKLLKRFKK